METECTELLRKYSGISPTPLYKISILSDKESWINEYLGQLVAYWVKHGHTVSWVHSAQELKGGTFAFFLGCSQIVPYAVRQLYSKNLVVHESDLPQGKGWSPLSWQILQGKNEIPIVLLEADDRVDSGIIYLQEIMRFKGTELIDELRAHQAEYSISLCCRFVETFPDIVSQGIMQTGPDSFYPKRGPADSRLNPDLSIREQFNLLRIVDNDRYPAFFHIDGAKYILKIIRET